MDVSEAFLLKIKVALDFPTELMIALFKGRVFALVSMVAFVVVFNFPVFQTLISIFLLKGGSSSFR